MPIVWIHAISQALGTIISDRAFFVNPLSGILLRAFDLSGFVARDLSGRHSHQKEVTNEADRGIPGDSEDEIQGSV
jgi:hypothetical protein